MNDTRVDETDRRQLEALARALAQLLADLNALSFRVAQLEAQLPRGARG